VARSLNDLGSVILDAPVSQIMSKLVASCERSSTVEELMVLMTDNRVRHVPVLEDGRLVGIVSIGDIVKARIEKLEDERKSLLSYITS
ncbi:MAG: CBS domain-containing protein, partial [Actinomycetes bacterium]